YTVNEGGASALYLAPIAQPTKARRLAVPPGVIGKIAFDRAGKRLAYSLSSARSSSDVYSFDLPAAQKPVQWTFSELAALARASSVTPTLIEYPSSDGKPIPAWYYKPRAAGKRVPVVVNIHGGPEAQSRPSFSAVLQYLVNELGVAVLSPNVRGSAGDGKSYLPLDNGFGRGDSVKDIGRRVRLVAQRTRADARGRSGSAGRVGGGTGV